MTVEAQSVTTLRPVRISPIDAIRLGLAVIIGAAVFVPVSVDPDLYGHLRYGLDALAQRILPSVDPYSFTSDRPWINHEWLAEVLMALAWTGAGPAGLSILKACLLGGALMLLRRRLTHGRTGDVFWVGALIAIAPLASTLRPQTFSVLLCVWVLDSLHRPRSRWIELPLAMCLWANLHGGWLVGAGVITTWVTIEILQREAPLRDALLPLLSVFVTLITPYGLELWRFLYDTVDLGRADISEWQPVWREPRLLPIWLGLSVVAFVSSLRVGGLPASGLSALLAFASLRVLRLIPFYGLVVVAGFGTRWPAGPPFHVEDRQRRLGLGLGAGMLMVAVVLGIYNSRAISFGDGFLLDREAAGVLHAARPRGRMVVYFDWGQYAIWHWAPELKVSYDGRRETVYSERIIAANVALYNGREEGLEYLDALEANWIWLPKELVAVREIRDHDGWAIWYETDRSVIFARVGAPSVPSPSQVLPVFP